MTHRESTASPPVRVLVVGGSLVGLSAAITLARGGAATVTVLERTAASGYRGGGGLGVDPACCTR